MPSDPAKLSVQTLTDLAVFFGVSRDTIRKDWRSQGVVPAKGPYNLSEIVKAKLNRVSRNEATGKTGSKRNYDDLAGEKLQKEIDRLNEQVRALQRENEAGEGALVKVSDVERRLIQWGVHIRNQLTKIPTTMSNLAPSDQKAEYKDAAQKEVQLLVDQMLASIVFGAALEDMILEHADMIRAEREAGK